MKRPVIGIIAIVSFLGLLAFQNCGKMATSQLDDASSKLVAPIEMESKQLIVKMKDGPSQTQLSAWAAAEGMLNINASDAKAMAAWDENMLSGWRWDGDMTIDQVKELLGQSELANMIEYAEPNYIYQESAFQHIDEIALAQRVLTQNSTFENLSGQLKAGLTPIQANTPRPVVAVIDSGLDRNHQAFTKTDAVWRNAGESGLDGSGNQKETNGIDDDSNGYVDDVFGYNFKDKNLDLTDATGHGTHCAGIVLGMGQNIFDLSVDYTLDQSQRSKIKIMPLKFIGPNGGSTSDAINAIFYAVNNGARVLSNSWGGPSYSKALEDAIAYAYDREVVFVAAAGNSANNNDGTPTYPASYTVPNMISVAASDNTDKLASFSNFGSGSVDMAAPGVSIKSTFPKLSTDVDSNGYNNLSGTSMATPMVSGVVALAIYENRYLTSNQLRNIVVDQSDNIDLLAGILKKPGRLNPIATINLARSTTAATTKPAYSRSTASASDSNESPKTGCGLVMPINNNTPPGPPPYALIALMMLPLAVAFKYRFV